MKIPTPQQLPSGSWRVQLNIDGHRISVTKKTEASVIKEAERILILHDEGLKPKATATIRLGTAIDDYIDARSNVLSPSTIRGYKACRSTRFQAYMNRPIGQIDWQRAVNNEAKLCSPKTLKNAWGLIQSALSENGMDVSVRLPAPTPHEKLWLTPEQIPAFLDAIQGKDWEVGPLLALSGLRRSEIYGLDWKDIDLDNKIIHVRRSVVLDENAAPVIRNKNKNASSTRDVPIFLPRLYDALNAVSDKSGVVVPGNIGTLRKRITRACKEANLPDVGVHGLRHSFASLCYSLGVSEMACMQLGGWSDYQTMRKIYTHLSNSDKMKGANKLSSFFESAHEMHTHKNS